MQMIKMHARLQIMDARGTVVDVAPINFIIKSERHDNHARVECEERDE